MCISEQWLVVSRTVYNRVYCMRVGVLRYYQVYSLFETEVALRGVALQIVQNQQNKTTDEFYACSQETFLFYHCHCILHCFPSSECVTSAPLDEWLSYTPTPLLLKQCSISYSILFDYMWL